MSKTNNNLLPLVAPSLQFPKDSKHSPNEAKCILTVSYNAFIQGQEGRKKAFVLDWLTPLIPRQPIRGDVKDVKTFCSLTFVIML